MEDLMSRTTHFMRTIVNKDIPETPAKRMNLRKKSRLAGVREKLSRHEMAIYGGALVVLIATSGTSAYLAREADTAASAQRAALAIEAGKLRPVLYRASDLSNKVVSGRSDLFNDLKAVVDQINSTPQTLMQHSDSSNVQRVEQVSSLLNKLMVGVTGVQAGEIGLKSVDKSMVKISGDFGDMSTLLADLSATLPKEHRITAIKIDAAMQRIGRTIASAYSAPSFTALMAEVGIAMEDVYTMVENLPVDDVKVQRVNEIVDEIGKMVEQMIGQAALISKAKSRADEIDNLSSAAGAQIDILLDEINAASEASMWVMPLVLGAFSFLLIAIMVFRFTQINRLAAKKSSDTNAENQDAIMALLDDLGTISAGDLTKKARVNESTIGVVADSVNFTIDELRALVKTIMAAAENIKKSTEETASMTRDLSAVAGEQGDEIRNATKLIEMVVKSIKDIDGSAASSADVARRTLVATDKGSTAVRASMEGMDTIRDYIQDTSKRIKRLGESSQEIGDIVAIIAGLSEQTRVLALNATLQAVQAGEAGRGFSIVAEEVKHLADRSAEATKQISDRIRLIQNDTHDAVAAMEKSTKGVVDGGKLTNEVSTSLSEINQVANELAGIIESITVSTQMQNEMSQEVTVEMNKLLKIVEKSSAGVKIVDRSVSEMAGLANGLENSVKRFKV